MATALDDKPSRIGPSTPARYARRAMRQALRDSDPGTAAKFAEYLENRNESATIRSAESRRTEDKLRDEQDAVIEQEIANVAAGGTPTPQDTAGLEQQSAERANPLGGGLARWRELNRDTRSLPPGVAPAASTPSSAVPTLRVPLGAAGGNPGANKPVPGGSPVPENKVLGDGQSVVDRAYAERNAELNAPPIDGQDIVNRAYEERNRDLRRAPIRPAPPRTVDELRASSARNFAEAERLRNITIDTRPAAVANRPPAVFEPAPDMAPLPEPPTLSAAQITGPPPVRESVLLPAAQFDRSSVPREVGRAVRSSARDTLRSAEGMRDRAFETIIRARDRNREIGKDIVRPPLNALRRNAERGKQTLRDIREFFGGALGD